MAISQTVIPISDVKLGIKAESTFGTLLDSDGTNTQAFRQLPVVQATKPTFNITRESRLLSGRGTVKNAADTIITNKNGTVTCPFDFVATPELMLEHLVMVTQTYNADGSDKYTVEVDGSNNNTSIGGTISSGLPHSVNLAYWPAASQGITVPGCVVSDMTISGDYAANGGNLSISGNYFSGFSNIFSSSGTGSLLEDNYTGTWVEPDAGQFFNLGSLQVKQLEVDGATQDMILKSFNLNITNGVNRVGSNSVGGAEAYAFPEYVVTGDITLKYDGEFGLSAGENVVQSFIDGNTCGLNLQFGDATPSSTGEMIILAEVQYTGDPTQDISENGIYWTIPFECVQNSTTEALKISLFSDTAIGSM
tara:strand:- start:1542 stop:2633 length:1092 start_codon:yes stop_codon:yes gene_type:complete